MRPTETAKSSAARSGQMKSKAARNTGTKGLIQRVLVRAISISEVRQDRESRARAAPIQFELRLDLGLKYLGVFAQRAGSDAAQLPVNAVQEGKYGQNDAKADHA